MGLVGVFGFFLGGCTNVSCIYAHLLLSRRTTFTASFILMLSTMSWNLIIAVLQFIVGGTTDYQNESMLHVVFALIIVMILILLLQIIFRKSENFLSL
jgi:membrane protein DedA with SNARE-associated domain